MKSLAESNNAAWKIFSRVIASKHRFFKCLTKAYRDSVYSVSLFNRWETLRGTYTSNTTRCVFLMVSARKHATRRRTAYNQHSDKLRSAYVLCGDSQRQETKKRYKAHLKKMPVDIYIRGKDYHSWRKKKKTKISPRYSIMHWSNQVYDTNCD